MSGLWLALHLPTAVQAQFSLEITEENGGLAFHYQGAFVSFQKDYQLGVAAEVGSLHDLSFVSLPYPPDPHDVDRVELIGSFPWSGINGDLYGPVAPGSHTFGIGGVPSTGIGLVYAPPGYEAGSYLSGSVSFTALTLADINMISGTEGTFTLGDTPINWAARGTPAVPEPSSAAVLVGLIALGFTLGRRTRRRSNGWGPAASTVGRSVAPSGRHRQALILPLLR